MSERENDTDEADGGGRPGLPVDPLRVWNALRRRWQIIVVAGVVGAFLGALIAKKFVSQNFGAHGVISWEGGAKVDPMERQTTIESVTLASNLEEVKRRMKLSMPPGALMSFISVGSSIRSNIITIDSVWPDGQGAAQLVNTLIDVFLENRDHIVRERLNDEVKRLRVAVAEAERRHSEAAEVYDKFRRDKGIGDISQERQLAIAQAATLSAQADAAKAQAEAARAQLEGMKEASQGESRPTLSEAELAQADKDERRLTQARQELDVAKLQFSADHPRVLRLQAEIEALSARVKSRYGEPGKRPGRSMDSVRRQAETAQARQHAAEEYQAQLRDRLNKLSAVEGEAAGLLGNLRVAEEALEAAKGMLTAAELQATKPPVEFRVLERAQPSTVAMSSPRKRVALGFPIVFIVLSIAGVLLWSFRKADVCTPKEAAFWSNLPVIGASTWPRDPDMLSSLMHDLDDYAPHCEGVTLIVGVSLEEAHLARRVAEWDGHRMPKAYDPQRLFTAGLEANSKYPIAMRGEGEPEPREPTAQGNMQILTLTGPVPAQALRRAARLADRVLVVAMSGKHSVFQLMKIRSRLGRDSGIGLLLVGLDKEFAMVRDRVGHIEQFWNATRATGNRAEA